MYSIRSASFSTNYQATRGFCAAFALAALALTGPARATANYFPCVTTAQELQDDLTAASDGHMYNGMDNTIYLAQGTYKTGAATGNGPFHYSSTAATGALIINGGYGPNCGSYSHDNSFAVLDGNNATQVLKINNTNAYVGLQLITIQNGKSSADGGGLSINNGQGNGSAQSVDVFNSVIRNNSTTKHGGGLAVSSSGTADTSLESNIIAGNSADLDFGAGYISTNSAGHLYVTRNTAFGNTTAQSGATGGLGCEATGTGYCVVVDNILWSNTNIGLYLLGGGNLMSFDDYGTLGGDTPTENYMSLSVNPKFVDSASGDFHLASGSPLIGASTDSLGLQIDPEGNEYAEIGKTDIGTFAETIFADSFGDN